MKYNKEQVREFVIHYKGGLFFIAGFIFDLFTLGRIDESFNLIQQSVYLSILLFLIYFRIRKENENPPPHFPRIDKLLIYHQEIFHFLTGSLLSAYMIFYFLSSSFISSFVFLLLIFGLLIINEVPHFHKLGTPIRLGLFQLCISSYFIFLFPILFKSVGTLIFLFSLFISILPCYLLLQYLIKKKTLNDIYEMIITPLCVITLYALLYLFSFIPPVPISIKKIGIYRDIGKVNDTYILSTEKPWWKFWDNGDQKFLYREGDKVYLFFSIFSPSEFKDHVMIQWQYWTENGWQKSDNIKVGISGGRELGYRGYTYKQNIMVGQWRALIFSSDEREIGRISFDIEKTENPLGEIRKIEVE